MTLLRLIPGLILGTAVCFPLAGFAAAPLVVQTDFGMRDGAVAAMKGVMIGVDPQLAIFDLTHEIAAFDIWEAAYRLKQTAPYWPAGTVFVSVVDPGVGTERRAIALETKSGHLFVAPDNGTLTLVADELGIAAWRVIDASRQRRPGSETSHTFHGRDVFGFTAARLAAGLITLADVGPESATDIVRLAYEAARRDGTTLIGTIPALDVQYGNVWSNISRELWTELHPEYGDRFRVTIMHDGKTVYAGEMPFVRTFGDVASGEPLLYLNSLLDVSCAINLGNFAAQHHIAAGASWSIRCEKLPR